MKANTRLFWILAAFLLLADFAYILWSILDYNYQVSISNVGSPTPQVEWVGAVGIALTAILSAFIAFYLGRTQGSVGGILPEDRPEAEIDDGDPEQGFFSPWSWWPIMLAFSAALLFLGIAVGVWISFIGFTLLLVSVVGWIYEYYRGNFAR